MILLAHALIALYKCKTVGYIYFYLLKIYSNSQLAT